MNHRETEAEREARYDRYEYEPDEPAQQWEIDFREAQRELVQDERVRFGAGVPRR